MKRIPTEEELLEIVELAKGAAQKARKLHNMLLENSARRRRMREARLGAQPYKGGTENVSGG